MAKRLSDPLSVPPTWRERIAAVLMDAEYGTERNAFRPDPHIDMVRRDPSYFLVQKHLTAADHLIASGVLGDQPLLTNGDHQCVVSDYAEVEHDAICSVTFPSILRRDGSTM